MNVEFLDDVDQLALLLSSQVSRIESPAEKAAKALAERHGWQVSHDEDQNLVLHYRGHSYTKLLYVNLSNDGLITHWMAYWWPIGDELHGDHASHEGTTGLADALMDPDGNEDT